MKNELMRKKETILQKTARLTGYSYDYVRQVNCGMARNQKISRMILALRREELAALTDNLRTAKP